MAHPKPVDTRTEHEKHRDYLICIATELTNRFDDYAMKTEDALAVLSALMQTVLAGREKNERERMLARWCAGVCGIMDRRHGS